MILPFSNTYVALEPNNIESSNIRATGDMRRLATAIVRICNADRRDPSLRRVVINTDGCALRTRISIADFTAERFL
jgi:hypothetical protein